MSFWRQAHVPLSEHAIWARFLRHEVAHRWDRTLLRLDTEPTDAAKLSASCFGSIHVSLWAFDSRLGGYVRLAVDASDEDEGALSKEDHVYPDSLAGHVDLVFESKLPLFVPELTASTRSVRILDDMTHERDGPVFIFSLTDPSALLPIVAYVSIQPRDPRLRPTGPLTDCLPEFLESLEDVTRMVQATLSERLRDQLHATHHRTELQSSTPQGLFEEALTKIVEPQANSGARCLAAARYLLVDDGIVTKSQPRIDERRYVHQLVRLLSRGLFTAANAKSSSHEMMSFIDGLDEQRPRARLDPPRDENHRFAPHVHPAFAIHDHWTPQLRVPIPSRVASNLLVLVVNLPISSTNMTPQRRAEFTEAALELSILGDAMGLLGEIADRSAPNVGMDLAHEIARRFVTLVGTTNDSFDAELERMRSFCSMIESKLDNADWTENIVDLLDRSFLSSRVTPLQRLIQESRAISISLWGNVSRYRLEALENDTKQDAVFVCDPEARLPLDRDFRTDAALRMIHRRRDCYPLLRLMRSMLSAAGHDDGVYAVAIGERPAPTTSMYKPYRAISFSEVRYWGEDGLPSSRPAPETLHIFCREDSAGLKFPYRSLSLVKDGGTITLILSTVTVDGIMPVVRALAEGAEQTGGAERHIISRWVARPRNQPEILAAVPVGNDRLAEEVAQAYTVVEGKVRIELGSRSLPDRAIAIPLRKLCPNNHFAPEFYRLKDALERGRRQGTLTNEQLDNDTRSFVVELFEPIIRADDRTKPLLAVVGPYVDLLLEMFVFPPGEELSHRCLGDIPLQQGTHLLGFEPLARSIFLTPVKDASRRVVGVFATFGDGGQPLTGGDFSERAAFAHGTPERTWVEHIVEVVERSLRECNKLFEIDRESETVRFLGTVLQMKSNLIDILIALSRGPVSADMKFISDIRLVLRPTFQEKYDHGSAEAIRLANVIMENRRIRGLPIPEESDKLFKQMIFKEGDHYRIVLDQGDFSVGASRVVSARES